MKTEIWKPIPGFDGTYIINKRGEIRRTHGKGKRTISPALKPRGALVARLICPNGKRKEYFVHKLVAMTYLPPGKGRVLYHRNEDKTDPSVGNLVWISKSELGRMTGARAKAQRVVKIDKEGSIVSTYQSARAAARDNFMSYQTVIDRCNGKVKSIYALDGYKYAWDTTLIKPDLKSKGKRETHYRMALPSEKWEQAEKFLRLMALMKYYAKELKKRPDIDLAMIRKVFALKECLSII